MFHFIVIRCYHGGITFDQLTWRKKGKRKRSKTNQRANEANEKLPLLDGVLSLLQIDECDLVQIYIRKCCNTFNDWCHMSAYLCVCAPQSIRVNRFPHSFGWYAGQVRTGKGELVESNGTTFEQQRRKADSKTHRRHSSAVFVCVRVCMGRWVGGCESARSLSNI